MKMLHILLLLLLSLSPSSLGGDITLSSASDFISFVDNVYKGSTYSGDTVYLDSDITINRNLEPIGNGAYQFVGVFDGQGHVISNLKVNSSSSQYAGLFGFSYGLTTRNVVLDSSCSITSSYSDSNNVCVGGIVGMCFTYSGKCSIEDSVNMADVKFSGNIDSNTLSIGGVVGALQSSDYSTYVKNCVNYGSVTQSGTASGSTTYLSGIVGSSYGSTAYNIYIQNCLNYGTVTHSGTSSNFIVGGILGNGVFIYIENCVSAGNIATQNTPSDSYIGSIVGKIGSAYINYCYFTSDVGVSSINGSGTPLSTTGTPDSTTDIGSELVSKLNSNATSCNWNKWFILHLNGGSINNLAQESIIEIQGYIPNPVKEGNAFLSWCKDAGCNEKFDPETETVDGITALYAGWSANNNIVTFDFDNGTTVNATFSYNKEIIYPNIKKEGYTLSWENYHELMPARDITVTAKWAPNNYTVTFDASGGNDLPDGEAAKTVTFDKEYGDLPEPNRNGYMFIGWFTNKTNGTEVTNKTIITAPDNHTLYAHWEEVTTYVEIVFDGKDLTKEGVEELLKQYTTVEFEIIKFENESGELTVIIEFVDKKEAEKFVRSIKKLDRTTSLIKRVAFDQGDYDSASAMIYPLPFLSAFFL